MVFALPLLILLAGGPGPGPIAGIPVPLEGAFDADLTKAASERVAAEMKTVLAQLDKDPRPESVKGEIRRKISRVKVAVYTSTKPLDEVVAFYEQRVPNATFIFAERGLMHDAEELARSAGFRIDVETEKAWAGKSGRSARWSREDGSVEIDVEDHLIDPRNGKISPRPVVMVTGIPD